MKTLTPKQHFWIAVLVIGGYLLFGMAAALLPVRDHSATFVTTVLATMGPLAGWVVKGLFEPLPGRDDDPTGPDQPTR